MDVFNVLTVFETEKLNEYLFILHGRVYLVEAVKGHRELIEKFAFLNK